MEQLLVNSWPDAGTALGIKRTKLQELIATGELESVKVGSRRLVPRDAIDAYIRKLRTQAGQDNAAA